MSEEKKDNKKVCMMCGKPSIDSICENCKANVQAEAVGEKQKIEKSVQVGDKVIADKKVQHKEG